MSAAELAAVVAVAVVLVALGTLILRRSLIAAAAAVGQACLGLGLLAAVQGRFIVVAVVVGAGTALVCTLCAVAVAVHRRRGSDHVDELRELQG